MLDYTRYLDKVYGCWLGKCIVGTVGAPYEGMKQLLHLEFDEKMIAAMLPNDDLDLQVLWLSVLEEKGIYTTGEDLAAAFSEKTFTGRASTPGSSGITTAASGRRIRPSMKTTFT